MINNKNNNKMTTGMLKFNFELPVKANIALNNYRAELKQKETQYTVKEMINDIISDGLFNKLKGKSSICSIASFHYLTKPKIKRPNQILKAFQYEYLPLKRKEEAIHIKEKIKLSISTINTFLIEKSYSKIKKLKLTKEKPMLPNKIIKEICFMIDSIEKSIQEDNNNKSFNLKDENNDDKKELELNIIDKKEYDSNTLVESTPKKNMLLDYLPFILSNQMDDNISIYNAKRGNQIMFLESQYDNIKTDLTELYPLLKKNCRLREQFFINISEGKEEKYTFFKNLYEIIKESNSSNTQDKPFKSQFKISNYSIKAKNLNYRTNINFFTHINQQTNTISTITNSSFMKGQTGSPNKLNSKMKKNPSAKYSLYKNNQVFHKSPSGTGAGIGCPIKHYNNNSYSFINHNNYL